MVTHHILDSGAYGEGGSESLESCPSGQAKASNSRLGVINTNYSLSLLLIPLKNRNTRSIVASIVGKLNLPLATVLTAYYSYFSKLLG